VLFVCKSSHLFWIFITEVAYRVAVPTLTNREIWLGLFLAFYLLDLFQIFSVDYGGEFPQCGETRDVIQVMKPKSKVRN
jgi:hypothetical protein